VEKYDLTGRTFGHWFVVEKDLAPNGSKNSRWICRCTCGTVKSVFQYSLLSGRSASCGCVISEKKKGINKTHGMSNTRIYREWASMRRRCKNRNDKSASSYFGKGITVCSEWDSSFETFYEWAIANGYSDNLTIDRIDNSLGYMPSNCRWVTNDEQQKNKTNTVKIVYNGKEWCLRALCIHIGFPYKTAHGRLLRLKKSGREITTDALFAPINTDKIAKRFRH